MRKARSLPYLSNFNLRVQIFRDLTEKEAKLDFDALTPIFTTLLRDTCDFGTENVTELLCSFRNTAGWLHVMYPDNKNERPNNNIHP